jgi:acetyl esterase/lipase
VSDCRDALAFVLTPAFDELTEGRVDTSRVFLSGSSAGGWLAMLVSSGLGFSKMSIPPLPGGGREKVRGTMPIYPISDITQPFWRTRQRPLSYLGGRVIDGPRELGEGTLDPKAAELAFTPPGGKRNDFYYYMVQEALLEELLLSGTGLKGEDVAIARGVREGEVSMPPMLIVHGTWAACTLHVPEPHSSLELINSLLPTSCSADSKVPFSQAEAVVSALRSRNLPVEFIVEEGKDHSYDEDPDEEMPEMYEFIKRLTAEWRGVLRQREKQTSAPTDQQTNVGTSGRTTT